MIRSTWLLVVLAVTACVTVNIYFPAAAVQKAADEIVDDTWGNEPKPSPPSGQKEGVIGRNWFDTYVSLGLVSEAHAQEADINISNPAIRAIKDRMRQRSDQLKPFLSSKNVGIDKNGYLQVLSTEGITLKERSQLSQLVAAENRDRKALYAEIAKANNLQDATNRIQNIFADTWRDKAQSGWQIQQDNGNWVTK
jgi:uncharacterized protein YdbL (DUF1318 family)